MTARRRPALRAGLLAATLGVSAVVAAPAAATLAVVAAPAPAAPLRSVDWAPVELGTLGGARTEPTAVNDVGHVVGRSQTADGRWHAFRWADGVMTDLTPDAQDATATDVSNRGHVSGWVQPEPGAVTDAVLWHDGATTVLAENAYALVVNERGQVGGIVDAPETWSANPFVWTRGTRADLTPPPFPGARTSASILDLDRRGSVLAAGEYDDDSDLTYVWSAGRFTELRDAVGPLRGVDLNERGHVAGSVHRTGWFREAALWRDGAIVRLAVLPGHETSQALALNDRDVVVGVSGPAPGARGTGFVWHDGVLEPVGADGEGWSEGWSVASDVNERGQVAGQRGATADGVEVTQPFVWQRGRLTALGTPTEGDVTVVDLSEKGHVLTVTGDLFEERGVLWVPTAQRS